MITIILTFISISADILDKKNLPTNNCVDLEIILNFCQNYPQIITLTPIGEKGSGIFWQPLVVGGSCGKKIGVWRNRPDKAQLVHRLVLVPMYLRVRLRTGAKGLTP
jgi:hypothetical protein